MAGLANDRRAARSGKLEREGSMDLLALSSNGAQHLALPVYGHRSFDHFTR